MATAGWISARWPRRPMPLSPSRRVWYGRRGRYCWESAAGRRETIPPTQANGGLEPQVDASGLSLPAPEAIGNKKSRIHLRAGQPELYFGYIAFGLRTLMGRVGGRGSGV